MPCSGANGVVVLPMEDLAGERACTLKTQKPIVFEYEALSTHKVEERQIMLIDTRRMSILIRRESDLL